MARKKAEDLPKLSGRELKRLQSKKGCSGAPRTFKSGEEFISLFEEFLLFVKAINYEILPTRGNFIWYLKEYKYFQCDYRTVYLTINQYYPEIKKIYIQMLEDVLSEGAALRHYNQIMTIFCLKNWCGWSDKNEQMIGSAGDKPLRIELVGDLDRFSK